MKVVVLESGGYYNESDFNHARALGLPEPLPGAAAASRPSTSNVTHAGRAPASAAARRSTGRTACGPPTRCASSGRASFGLEGLDGPEYDRHLDAVLERIGANDECSDLQRPAPCASRRAREKLGFDFRRIVRNADPATYEPGDRRLHAASATSSGSKQSTARTFLARRGRQRRRRSSSAPAPAGSSPRAAARRGRGASIARPGDGPHRHGHGAGAAGRRRLRRARVAGPAAALRDRRPRRRPTTCACTPTSGVAGVYDEDQHGLVGRAADRDDRRVRRHRGRLRLPGRDRAVHDRASAPRWCPSTAAEAHKEAMLDGLPLQRRLDRPHCATAARPGDDRRRRRGGPRATRRRRARHRATPSRASRAQLRIHEARGRQARCVCFAPFAQPWQRGEDLDAFLEQARNYPLGFGGDPALLRPPDGQLPDGHRPGDERRDPWGELHDTPGVWIGDAQRLPDRLRDQPDDLDHGPRPPHRRGDRRRLSR